MSESSPKIELAIARAMSISRPTSCPSELREARPSVFSSTATTSFPRFTMGPIAGSAASAWALGSGANGA